MITSFGDEATYHLFESGNVPDQGCGWEDVADVAGRKLDMLDAAEELTDLYTPPGNRFESVEGDWYTIRINDQWRIKFQWDDGDAEFVHICDPHD
jgi:proteic killer suppression protein